MELPEFVKTLQKKFENKVILAERMNDRRGFIVSNSLDNKIGTGTPLIWDNLRNLSQKGYAIVLYDNNLHEKGFVRASAMDEINSIKIKDSSNENISKGPTSFREVYDHIATRYPIVVSD